jgi:hypothetical protein
MNKLLLIILISSLFSCQRDNWELKVQNSLSAYRTELDSFRHEFGGSCDMPDVKWFQFGMGNRTKIIYKHGALINAITTDTLFKWSVSKEYILPAEYTVILKTINGSWISITEDSSSVKITEDSKCKVIPGTESFIKLPDFENFKYPGIMRVLHQEILINIIYGMPVPNFYVYSKPWRRDAAMMAMCLNITGNIGLIKDWTLSLSDPYDRNNAGETEADNLGQTLYILSFFSDSTSKLVSQILKEVNKFEVKEKSGTYIKGRSDFHEVPVYQTKWLKYGLKSMKIPDKYIIPDIADNYSALFWWDYKEHYVPGVDANDRKRYSYLGWACDHFHGEKKSPISNRDYPLTWEIKASQANYKGMATVDSTYVHEQNSSPHTWHASEIFLYLLEIKK